MKYVSGRVKELKVGISSHSESKTSLTVIGNANVSGALTAASFVGGGINTAGTSEFTNLDLSGYLNVAGISTFAGAIDANGNLDVDGHTELDNLNVSGVSTFAGIIDSNGQIVGAATSNIVPFLYSNYSLFPSATTYHGAVAHAHNTGKLYYAHGGNWIELVNKETNGTVGTGTEKYDIGITSVTNLRVAGISTYDGNLDVQSSVLITGITTIGGLVDINAGGQANTFKVEDLTAGRVVLAGTGGEIEDSGNLTFNGATLNTTQLTVSGVTTTSGLVDINAGAQANTLKVEDLTDNRVVIAGTGGELEDDANLTFNGTTFNVGSAITMYQATGIVSATSFFGDGSGLENTGATLSAASGSQRLVLTSLTSGTMTSAATDADLSFNATSNLLSAGNLLVSGISTLAGNIFLGMDPGDQINVTGRFISGLVPIGNGQYNLGTTGLYWKNLFLTGNAGIGSLTVSGISTFGGNATFNGNVNTVHNLLQVDGNTTLGVSASDNIDPRGSFVRDLIPNAAAAHNIGSSTRRWKTLHVENIYTGGSGIATFKGAIDADGGANIAGGLVADTAKISDLTNTRVVYAGTNGELQDSANLTFNGTTLNGTFSGDGTALLVTIPGISTTTTSQFTNLTVTGNTVLATAKVSDLTDNRIVIAGASGELEDTSKLTFDGSTLSIVGDATFTGNVSVAGTLTSEDKTNIDSIGIVTARTGVRINSGGLVISSGVATFTDAIDSNGGANISGGSGLVASTAKISDLTNTRVVFAGAAGELQDNSGFTFNGSTVTAPAFSGDGSALTGITAGGVGAIGGLTVKDEGVVVGTAGSVSTLDFKGVTISAIATPGAAGVATITATTDPDPEFSTLSVTGVSTLGSPSANNTTFINSSDAANSEANTLVLGHGSGNYVGMTLQMASNYSGGIYFTDTNNGKQGGMAYYTLGDELRFYANTSQRLALNSNGTTISNGSLFIHDKITHAGDTDTHLRFPAADTFTVEVGGTETLRVSPGLVTINPQGANHAQLTINSTESSATAGPVINLVRDDGAPTTNDYLGIIKFNGSNSAGAQLDYVKLSGKILDVTSTSEDAALEIKHYKAGSETVTAEFRSDSLQLLNGTSLTVAGDVSAPNFNSTSDAKLKTNVETITSPLEKLNQIDGVTFNWISDNKPSMGVIADTVEKVLPELVTSNDPKTVNYNGLIGLLIEAVKEQQVQITELKSKLDSLS